MLKRLSSAISTAHAISLAIREAPDAIRTVCSVATAVIENDNTNHASRKFLKAAFDRAKERDEVKRDLDLVEFIANEVWLWSKERITQLQVDVDSLGGALVAEHKIAMDYAAEITEAREQLEAAQKERAHYEGRIEGIVREIASLRVRVAGLVDERDGAVELVKLTGTVYDELKAKLARHEEAERWHRVTGGNGELPPEGVNVIYGLNPLPSYIGKPWPNYVTFAWRYASSEDVPK